MGWLSGDGGGGGREKGGGDGGVAVGVVVRAVAWRWWR
jgi:hypothetical protein